MEKIITESSRLVKEFGNIKMVVMLSVLTALLMLMLFVFWKLVIYGAPLMLTVPLTLCIVIMSMTIGYASIKTFSGGTEPSEGNVTRDIEKK